jgi:hypothetical protein
MRIDAEVEDGEEVELGAVHNRVCRMRGTFFLTVYFYVIFFPWERNIVVSARNGDSQLRWRPRSPAGRRRHVFKVLPGHRRWLTSALH